jgi:hypothetical protein
MTSEAFPHGARLDIRGYVYFLSLEIAIGENAPSATLASLRSQ